MSEPRVHIVRLIANDGSEAVIAGAGVTCVVGANNVGKSRLLREVRQIVQGQARTSVVLDDVDIEKTDSSEQECEAWLIQNAVVHITESGSRVFQAPLEGSQRLALTAFHRAFTSNPNKLGEVRPYFVGLADIEARTQLASGALGTNEDLFQLPHPFARIATIPGLEARFSEVSEEVFGFGITLDRISGPLRLRIDTVNVEVPRVDNITEAYRDAVLELEPVSDQGDGVKSFLGLVLFVLTASQTVVLIDEPEAFLHQSQARAFGRWVAGISRDRNMQVIMATHDRNIIVGVMSELVPLSVVRLTRNERVSTLHQLTDRELRETWNDPVLRYSNVLDGLFHSRVVICEDDSDCRFYAAAIEGAINRQGSSRTLRIEDILFVPSGGKGGMPKVAKALTALDVGVCVIADFDLLRVKRDVKRIVDALRRKWSESCEGSYRILADAMNANGGVAWNDAKSNGVASIPVGGPTTAVNELLAELSDLGLVVVRCGAMEGFERSISETKSGWVNRMLERNGHLENTEVVAFSDNLLRALIEVNRV